MFKTTITNQNVNDLDKILSNEDYTKEEYIKICIMFGSLLNQQDFKEGNEYYTFLEEFKKYIDRVI